MAIKRVSSSWPAMNTNNITKTYNAVNVLWNNTFRRIFNCCWRESTSSLQFYCSYLPMSHTIDQQTILYYRRILRGSNSVLRILLQSKQGYVSSLLVKYGINSLFMPQYVIKHCIWNTFVIKNTHRIGVNC